MPSRVLLVDDECAVLNALVRALKSGGYEILTAECGPEALKILSETEVSLILCDHNMPGMTGAKSLAEARKIQPDAVRVTLTGNMDLETAKASINNGRISHFLLKPWDDDELRLVVREGVRRFELQGEVRRLHDLTRQQRDELEEWNSELEVKVQERTEALYNAYEETLHALILALDSREHATAGHSRRVALYCLWLALECGVPEDKLEDLHRGALLHDIGKIGVPDAVLLKPGELDSGERRIIEQHVAIGGQLLENIDYLKNAMAIPRYHHERFDGKGYREGLSGDEIPIEARVFAIVDVYDALRSERPYKKAMSHEHACDIIATDSGEHFDPEIADVFLRTSAQVWSDLAVGSQRASSFSEVLTACLRVKLKTEALPRSSIRCHVEYTA